MTDKFVLTIDKQELSEWVLIVFLTLPHLNPPIFEFLGLDYLIDVYRIVSMGIILITIFLNKLYPSKISILLILQHLYILTVTLFNGGESLDYIKDLFSVLAVLLIYELFISDSLVFLNAELFCFELIIYLNFLSILVYPEGMYSPSDISVTRIVSKKCWFLGYYNSWVVYFIPAFVICLLYMYKTQKKLRGMLLISIMCLSALYTWSGGVIASLFGMIVIYLFFKNRTSVFNYAMYWFSQLLFLLVCFILGINFSWVNFIIDNILGKSTSLLLRVQLWTKYLQLIIKSPIFGYGYTGGLRREEMMGLYWAAHAHNLLLENLFRGGVINLMLFALIIYVAGKYLIEFKNATACKLIATAFAGWCIDSYVETYMSPFLMGMFVLAYYIGKSEIIQDDIHELFGSA